MAVSVAGGKDALLLCETDHGAACYTRHNSLGWRIHCVKGGVPEAFSPECELPITYEKSQTVAAPKAPAPVVLAAASTGDLLVLFMADHPDFWLETWDMKTDELLDSRPTDLLDLHMRLWVCNDTVYWLHFVVNPQGDPEENLHTFLLMYTPRERAPAYVAAVNVPEEECLATTYTIMIARDGDRAFQGDRNPHVGSSANPHGK